MNQVLVLLPLLFMTLVGFSLIKLLNAFGDKHYLEILPYAFGLGAGVVSFQLYAYSRVGLSWQFGVFMLPWILLFLFCIYQRKLTFKIEKRRRKNSLTEKLFIVVIAILMIYVLIESFMRPVTSWDGWSSWLLRAKMFFIEKGVTPATFAYIPSEYPVIVSLMSTFLYLSMGRVDDRSVLLLYPFFYISLGLLFFNSLKLIIGKKIALLFTFLVLSIQNIIRHSGRFEAGQADIILGFYTFASMMLFSIYTKTRNIRTLFLLQMFLAITALIKDDGISLVIFIETMLLVSIIKSKEYKHLFLTAVWLLPFCEWQFFKSKLMLPSVPSYIGSGFHLNRIPLILAEFTKEFLNIGNWNFLWIAFFVSTVIFLSSIRRNLSYLPYFGIVIFQIVVYAGVFLFTSPDPQNHIPNVINRAFLHIAPIALFAVALNVAIIKRKFRNGKV